MGADSRERRNARQRLLDWLRASGPADPQSAPGRGQIVERFHEVRRKQPPPVMVIQGAPGSGKGRLITHLQAGYRRRVNWWAGLSIDARLDLTEGGLRSVEMALASLRQQLRTRRPFWRVTAVVLTPRFAMLQARLWRHRIRIGAVVARDGHAIEDAKSIVKTATAVTSAIKHGSLPLVPLSPRAGVVRLLRLGWECAGLTNASRWVKDEVHQLTSTRVHGRRDQFTTAELQRGLSRAMAADLKAASRRRWLRPAECVIFVDGYDLTESSGTPAHSWVADFADALREFEAPVMLVLGCRTQRLWSERLDRDQELYTTTRQLGLFDGSPRVEVHTLDALPPEVCHMELMNLGVPEALAPRLTELACGHPLALNLLGMIFSKEGSERSTRLADPEHDAMLEELRALSHPNAAFDEAWVRRFCAKVAPALSEGLSQDLETHARAAATLRSFDRDLLAHVMGDSFRGQAFDDLVRTSLVVSPRPSALLKRRGDLDDRAYRLRSFLREFWAAHDVESHATRRWNRRAAEYFEEQAASAADDDRRFALLAEALFHRLCEDRASATTDFREAFSRALEQGRFDRCEAFIGLARDVRPDDRGWRADIEERAGRAYHHVGNYVLAEECFRAAKQLAGEDPDIEIRAAQGVASCRRMRGSFERADEEVTFVLVRADGNHVARFQGVWTASLIARDRGELDRAETLANDASALLTPLLEGGNGYREAARAHGLHHLARKPAHLLRHRAEIARRAGRYRDGAQLLVEARQAYEADPEPEAMALLDVVRAHLLRLEGRASDATEVALEAEAALARCEQARPRSTLMALRSIAQAKLAGDQPEQARGLLERLASLDADGHPVIVAVARHGLGELERLAGAFQRARSHYEAARSSAPGIEVLEHVYGQLGLAELEREAGEPQRACKLHDAIDQNALAEHPLLSFWACLLGARAYASIDGGWMAGRHARKLLDRARAELGRLQVHDEHPLHGIFAQTSAAVHTGGPFDSVGLLLP